MAAQYTSSEEIIITSKHRDAGFAMPEDHVHPCFEFYYVKSGTCCFFLNDTLHTLNSGDCMLIAPGDLHHTLYLQDETCDRIVLYFKAAHILSSLVEDIPDFREVFGSSCHILINPAFKEVIDHLLEHMLTETRIGDVHSKPFLATCMHQLFFLILRYRMEVTEDLSLSEKKDAGVLRSAKYIYQNYASPLSLNEVASIAGLSPTYFSRKFKEITGVGFKEYVNFVRMKNATLELMTTKNSITDIALNNGFTDGNYFKDTFKKVHGCSPREYRNSVK